LTLLALQAALVVRKKSLMGAFLFVLSADFLQSSTSDSPHVKELVRKEEHVV